MAERLPARVTNDATMQKPQCRPDKAAASGKTQERSTTSATGTSSDAPRLTGLRRGLNETGYIEGRNPRRARARRKSIYTEIEMILDINLRLRYIANMSVISL